ncbi:MAG: sulfatase-like hydrolase/transferase [Opitutales bacterium]
MRLLPLLVCLLACGPALAASSRPNILVIVSDDQGYNDVGFNGGKAVPTPHLDALAASGVRCTSGYVSHPFCSPTRAGLLTGRYQQRFGHENNPAYNPADAVAGLPLSEKLLPQFLKETGYKTGWIGKWHLGATPAHTPWARGFDQTYGFIGGGHAYSDWAIDVKKEYNVPLTRDGQATPEVPAHLTEAFGKEAAAFIRRNAGAPWMLYLAFNAPHTPHMPTIEREKQFADVKDPVRRKCLAQISLLDDAVGAVTKALADSGQAQDTLVFFFSDNGGTPPSLGADNTPLRGNKGMVYEGGIRVPFVVSWPAQLKAGSTYGGPVSSLDVAATALALAGAPSPSERRLDGVNLIPFLKGEDTGLPHANLFWRTGGGSSYAVRAGQWKLVRNGKQPDELYDLEADLSESKDLAAAKPELAARLASELTAWNTQLIQPLFQSPRTGKTAKKGKK